MPDDWRKIERGLFESADGRYRIANPYKLTTELRHRWLVADRRSSGTGWTCTTATTPRCMTPALTSCTTSAPPATSAS
jgi:hypothetical protein